MGVVSIIIPALNEQDGIQRTIQTVPRARLEDMGHQVQILVVDNDSKDTTATLARQSGADVITEARRGYGRAYKTGFAQARGDIIATADADLSYPMEDIPRLVATLEQENLDFVTTNRFASLDGGAMSLKHRLGNTVLSIAVRLLFGIQMRDPESGMWVFRKDILGSLKLGADRWPFSHELKLEACHFNRYRWKEVPIRYRARVGETKLTSGWKVGFHDLFHILKKRFIR